MLNHRGAAHDSSNSAAIQVGKNQRFDHRTRGTGLYRAELECGLGRLETIDKSLPVQGGEAGYRAGSRLLTGTAERNTRGGRHCVGIAERRTLLSYSRAFYYLTFRVIERKAVFKSTRAREKFLEYLASANTTMRWCMRIYFIFGAKESHLVRRASDQNLPGLKQLADRLSIRDISAELENALPVQLQLTRDIKQYLFQKHTRMRLKCTFPGDVKNLTIGGLVCENEKGRERHNGIAGVGIERSAGRRSQRCRRGRCAEN
jgi:hypothetical protein